MHAMQCKAVAPNVFVWLDTCNVYVIKDGASAILIDIGDGLVLDALLQIGVTTVECVALHAPPSRAVPGASTTRWPCLGQLWCEGCRAGKRLGIKVIDAVLVTHMHGDKFSGCRTRAKNARRTHLDSPAAARL